MINLKILPGSYILGYLCRSNLSKGSYKWKKEAREYEHYIVGVEGGGRDETRNAGDLEKL